MKKLLVFITAVVLLAPLACKKAEPAVTTTVSNDSTTIDSANADSTAIDVSKEK